MLIRALTVALVAAVTLGATATTSHAQSVQAIAFTVSDAASFETYLEENPNCAPYTTCKPLRVPGDITFKVSTNATLAGQTLFVKFETVNGTALAGSDFDPVTGTLSFTPDGGRDRFVTVQLNSSFAVEPTETFTLKLKEPSVPADVSDAGVGTIFDGAVRP